MKKYFLAVVCLNSFLFFLYAPKGRLKQKQNEDIEMTEKGAPTEALAPAFLKYIYVDPDRYRVVFHISKTCCIKIGHQNCTEDGLSSGLLIKEIRHTNTAKLWTKAFDKNKEYLVDGFCFCYRDVDEEAGNFYRYLYCNSVCCARFEYVRMAGRPQELIFKGISLWPEGKAVN